MDLGTIVNETEIHHQFNEVEPHPYELMQMYLPISMYAFAGCPQNNTRGQWETPSRKLKKEYEKAKVKRNSFWYKKKKR